MGLGGYRTFALLANIPWRALVLGVPSAVLLYWIGRAILPEADDGLLTFGCFLLVVVLGGIQALSQRDVLTPTHLIQRRGLVGEREVRTPLESITRVEYHYPRWGSSWNVGDISIATDTGGLDLIGVVNPAEGAQAILDAKAQLTSKTTRGRGRRPTRA